MSRDGDYETEQIGLRLERLRELLDYDPDTGVFHWKVDRGRKSISAGCVAGCAFRGYTLIRIDQILYLAHRLAWFYVHGAWPTGELDHRNENKSDNRIANLRDVSHLENMHNIGVRSTNRSGYLGVSWDSSRGRWLSQIRANGTNRFLGRFDTAEEAHRIFMVAKAQLHPSWRAAHPDGIEA